MISILFHLQHGINALQMLVELCLNQLPIAFYMMGFVGLYSCAFGLWALSVYVQKGLWCANALAVPTS